FHVITAGGGGIPVVETETGFEGIDAVVDKDAASALLANQLGAELLMISTAVREVKLHFGTPKETPLGTITAAEAEKYAAEGNFAPGSMLPKIEAALQFLRNGGRRVVITDPAHVADAVGQGTGTHILP
ncbi:MAG: carbamate kinase, partial [Rhodospirillales bacterium]|nr:carbamate kinase [Rhodospirillales bacterium]